MKKLIQTVRSAIKGLLFTSGFEAPNSKAALKYLQTEENCQSHIKAAITFNSLVSARESTPESAFINQYFGFELLPYMAINETIITHEGIGKSATIPSFMNSPLSQSMFRKPLVSVNPLYSLLMGYRYWKHFRSLSIYKKANHNLSYIVSLSSNEDKQVQESLGFSKNPGHIAILNGQLDLLKCLVFSVRGFDSLFSFIFEKITKTVELYFSNTAIQQLGTLRWSKSVEFLENPIYAAAKRLGIKSFGIQQRAINVVQIEWSHGYFDKFYYWDPDSQRIHGLSNTVHSPRIIPLQTSSDEWTPSQKKFNPKRIIAFPNEVASVVSGSSFQNIAMAKDFIKFLRELQTLGFEILVKPKSANEAGLFQEFTTVTSDRGDYWSIINDQCACVVSPSWTTPSLEISVKSSVPAFYFIPTFLRGDDFAKWNLSYPLMQVHDASDLASRLKACADKHATGLVATSPVAISTGHFSTLQQ